jgi:hypothetical protein
LIGSLALVFLVDGAGDSFDLRGIDDAAAFGFLADQETEGRVAAKIEIDEMIVMND